MDGVTVTEDAPEVTATFSSFVSGSRHLMSFG